MTTAATEAPKVSVHDILDHLVSISPLDEATRILFHHSIADGRDEAEPVEGARARVDVTAATPIDLAYNDEALKAVQAENAQLKEQIDAQTASIADLRRLVELALNQRNPAPDAQTAAPSPAPEAAPVNQSPVQEHPF